MIPVTPLVSIEDAKRHLRVTDDAAEAEVQAMLDAATTIVIDYINASAHWAAISATWTELTLPGPVYAAILLELTYLYQHRGDAVLEGSDPAQDDGLAPGVKGRLMRYRDPAVA